MDEYQVKEIKEAINAADEALFHLRNASRELDKARGWGIWDIIGGGLLTNLIKHGKMRDAEYEIGCAKDALARFNKELRDVAGYSTIHIDSFLTFADFFFDGLIADLLVQSKIRDAIDQCNYTIRDVEKVREDLVDKLGRRV
ncbi:MAG: hypothetical protein II688_03990 [Lachnospiraceae bacterium]|nr:hypothetical protein [Lachnospiraceae bacterium]